jgi:hypothetical protein
MQNVLPSVVTADRDDRNRIRQWRKVCCSILPAPRSLSVSLTVTLLSSLLFSVTPKVSLDPPVGTAIPVMLRSEVNAKKDKAGQKIEGRIMQDILLASGSKIKAGSQVRGHIVRVSPPTAGGSRVALKFDELESQGHTIPLTVSLRALASMQSVYEAGLPVNASSDTQSTDQWVTRQVGGDVVNRGRGAVGSDSGIVGRWSYGVWAKLTPAPQAGCNADDGNNLEQSLWIFSTSACGVYGLSDLKLLDAGWGDPPGVITLDSRKDLVIRGGSGWLLLVMNVSSESASKP